MQIKEFGMYYFKRIIVLMAFAAICINVQAAETIAKFNDMSKSSTSWVYSATGEEITVSGVKNRDYPITVLPVERYLKSEPVAVVNYKTIGVNAIYTVSTSSTHPLMLEVCDEAGEVEYSHLFEGEPNVQMSVAGRVSGLSFKSETVSFVLRMSGAYNESELLYVDEIQIYGTLKPWNERVLTGLSVSPFEGGAEIAWDIDKDAVGYKIECTPKSGGVSVILDVDAQNSLQRQSETVGGLIPGEEYWCRLYALNADDEIIESEKVEFIAAASINDIYGSLSEITVLDNQIMIKSTEECQCNIYSISGVLVCGVTLVEGENLIPLPAGVYIINQPGVMSRLISVR